MWKYPLLEKDGNIAITIEKDLFNDVGSATEVEFSQANVDDGKGIYLYNIC